MLGFFPDFYPDELFYSACARYQDHAHFPNKSDVSKLLFGNTSATAWIHLPHHLNRFVASLPPQASTTADDIIDNHTTLPYLSPFISSERILQARIDMKSGTVKTIHNNVGIRSDLILLPDWLRYCPRCAEDDRITYGERYWHRLHQLPGVEVCPQHIVFLENSSARARHRVSNYAYISAEKIETTHIARSVDLSDRIHQALMHVARDAKWLLSQRDLLPGCQALGDRYLKLLAERRLATRSGFVRQERLKEFLANCYSPELLAIFPGSLSERNDWFTRMLTRLKLGHTIHPLMHLLMIQALGYTAEEFFGAWATLAHGGGESDDRPFGEAPWPCLNKTSEHYQQSTIREYQLTYTREPNSRPMGTFVCNCGFVYVRIGPDTSAEDKRKFLRIESHGALWETTVARLWADPSLYIREICERVGLGQAHVLRKQVARLGLPSLRTGPIGMSGVSRSGPITTYFCKHIPGPQALSVYRREWLEGIKMNPEARTTNELIKDKALALVYRRLLKHDPEWLSANKPQSSQSHLTLILANRNENYWEALDIRLAPEVELVAQQLKKKDGRPVRISRHAIMRETGLKTKASKQLNQLPKTVEVLTKYIETPIENAVRRIQWAAGCFYEEGTVPTMTSLKSRAGIGYSLWKLEAIKMAADTALSSLAKRTMTLSKEKSGDQVLEI